MSYYNDYALRKTQSLSVMSGTSSSMALQRVQSVGDFTNFLRYREVYKPTWYTSPVYYGTSYNSKYYPSLHRSWDDDRWYDNYWMYRDTFVPFRPRSQSRYNPYSAYDYPYFPSRYYTNYYYPYYPRRYYF